MSNLLNDFNRACAGLFAGIELDCAGCSDPDCLGAIWLLPEEAERLYDAGIPVVQINGGPWFIQSYPALPGGGINVSAPSPPCRCRLPNRRCGIHASRPIVCRIYPLGLETDPDGFVVWVLHTDCRFVRRKMEETTEFPEFLSSARRLLEALPPDLREKLVSGYRMVDAISAFPNGPNAFIVLLKEVVHVQV